MCKAASSKVVIRKPLTAHSTENGRVDGDTTGSAVRGGDATPTQLNKARVEGDVDVKVGKGCM